VITDVAPAGIPVWLVTIVPVLVAIVSGVGTAITVKSSQRANAISSIDKRLESTLGGNQALIDDLREEVQRKEAREEVLLTRLTSLEAQFSAYKDQTDAQIRDLRTEVYSLRSSEREWRRWADSIVVWSEDAIARLARYGETMSPLPPSPPLA
jgi:hypothetical protein